MKSKASLYLLSLFFCFTAMAQKTKPDTTVMSYSSPVSYTIKRINVTGDAYLDKNIILSIAGLTVGQKINVPGDEVSKAIMNLWKQNLFANVQILEDSTSGNNIYLSINVQSRPRLSRYKFSGLTKQQVKKVKEEIHLSSRDILTEQLLSVTRMKIKDYFTRKGHPYATVSFVEKPDTLFRKNSVELDITVDIGKRVKIHKIYFTGNEQFTEAKLKHTFKKTKEKKWYNIFRSSKFEPDEYDDDKAKLLAFYHRNGFKDAKIVSDSTSPYEDNLVDVHINMSEGHKYYFRNIVWSGNTKYSSKDLAQILNIKKGDVYNPEQLERNLYINEAGIDITSLYMDDGYLFFSVTPVETHVENDSVDIEIRMFEGPQATINKVTVVGNTKTHDHVILRELRTKPGQKFSRADIIRSQRELSQLGYFDPEKMNVSPKPNPKDGTVDLEYTVVEKASDQIELSGGWGAGQLVGVLGLTLNNLSVRNIFKKGWQGYPSGDGQRLSIRAQTNGTSFQSYNASFTEPWFGGKKPNSLTVSLFYSVQKYGDLTNPSSLQILKSPGASVGLGQRLKWPDDYFVLNNSISYQYYAFQNYPLGISNFTSGYANNLNFRHLLVRNSAGPDPIYPTSGSVVSFSLQWTPPYSLLSHQNYADMSLQDRYKYVEFHKWKFSAQDFMGLTHKKKLVLFTEADFGFLGTYNQALGVTPFERFYVGGDGLTGYYLDGRELIRFRGYNSPDDVTPKETNISNSVTTQGGTIYDRFTMELRYKVVGTPTATIYGLGFIEGGNAWLHFNDFNPFDVKKSAGVGVRVFLPMFGLLGVDWGYGFDKSLMTGETSGGHFHFYIGQPLY